MLNKHDVKNFCHVCYENYFLKIYYLNMQTNYLSINCPNYVREKPNY